MLIDSLPQFQLRDYQVAAVEKTVAELERRRSALFILPTGAGKTEVAGAIVQRLLPELGRALVIEPSVDLVRQTAERLRRTGLSVGVEMADQRAHPADQIVVATIQTMSRPERLPRFARDAFGLLCLDEAHHAPARSYLRLLEHFSAAKVVGCTATPDRLDQQGLGEIFEVASFVYPLRQAIQDGWLVKIRQQRVLVNGLDLSRVRMTAGDLNEADLAHVLNTDEHLHQVAGALVERAEGRPTLVFAVDVAHARALAEVIGMYSHPACVAVLVGTDDRKKREETLEAFQRGRLLFLVNVALFGEGFDCPSISCVAMVRPTASRARYAQCIGRGLRLAPNKQDLLVLDFAGNAGRHHLVNTFDILAERRDPPVEARAQSLMDDSNVDLLEALETAEAEIAAEQRRAVQFDVTSRVIEVDAFLDAIDIPSIAGEPSGRPITEGQLVVLKKNGIPVAGLDRGQASNLIDWLAKRTAAGLSTFKQARLLVRYGHDPDIPFRDASRIIAEIAANGWRRRVA